MLEEKRITALLATFFVVLVVGFLAIPAPIPSGGFLGHALGIAGTIIMLMTLIYPFRKRILGKKGKTNPLTSHIYYGLIGPTLVVLHSGHSLASVVGNITFLSMLIVVLSGIVGKYLFRSVNRTLKEERHDLSALNELFERRKGEISASYCRVYFGIQEKPFKGEEEFVHPVDEDWRDSTIAGCRELHDIAQSIAETEHATSLFSATKTIFQRWMRVHIYLTMFLFSMVVVHVLTSIYYGLKWIP